MQKRLSSALLTPVLLVVTGLVMPIAWAKPPDLPVNAKDTCVPLATDWQAPLADLGCLIQSGDPTDNPAVWSQEQVLDANAYKAHSARHFYEIAKECEANGDWAMARNCYDEARRVAPISLYGQLASWELRTFEMARAVREVAESGAETEEEPPQARTENATEVFLETRRVAECHHMLQLGERYRRAGDIDNAYRCFEDANVLCPTCPDGQHALDQMMRLEAQRFHERQLQLGGTEEQETPVERRPPLTAEEVLERDHAHALFQQGERLLRDGDMRKAYDMYEETHLAFPNSYYGMRAIERMHEIETRREAPTNSRQQQGSASNLTPPIRGGGR